ncbi:MAG: GatB/YqeY domain-containing protein [Kiloniellales bacterium]|nr:GatB/YqeY domain-containing protein [Kiloniellales bacterium]
MLRQELNESLKEAMKAKDSTATSTIRLILAALKDRDIAARSQGSGEKLSDEQILEVLQKMVRQRRDSIEMYAKGGRQDLVERETREIEIIERFLPKPLSDAESAAAVRQVISELGASSLKEMGQVMGELKRRHAGRMDFAKASALVKEALG